MVGGNLIATLLMTNNYLTEKDYGKQLFKEERWGPKLVHLPSLWPIS